MDYTKLIKMLVSGDSEDIPTEAKPLSEITEAKSPTASIANPSASPASSAGSNPMKMLSGLLGGGSKENESNPNMEMIKAAATPIIGGSSDEYMAKMNALRNMRNR